MTAEFSAVDLHISRRLRELRLDTGKTMEDVAPKVGVTYQQWQKYETGKNRISAGRLWLIAEALRVPVNAFYQGLSTQ